MSETTDLLSGSGLEDRSEGSPELVEIPPGRFLAIEGMGEPGGEVYRLRLGYLLSVHERLRGQRDGRGRPFPTGRLEVFFWGVKGPGDFFEEPRTDWNWRLALQIPDSVTTKDVTEAIAGLLGEGRESEIAKVRIFEIHEGRCVQVLHVGTVDEVRRSVERIGELVREHGLSFHGLHHEIYLDDSPQSPSEPTRMIIRMPVC